MAKSGSFNHSTTRPLNRPHTDPRSPLTSPDVHRYFHVERRDLVYLKFILEAYEGMSTLSTVDRLAGIVELTVPLPFAADMDRLIQALQQEIALTELPSPSPEQSPEVQ